MFGLVLFAGITTAIFFISRALRKSRIKALETLEAEIADYPVLNYMPKGQFQLEEQKLVIGSAVVGLNWVSRMVVYFRMIIGGNLPGYERLIDEARRMALVRMVKSAPKSDLFVNCRFDNAQLASGHQYDHGYVEIVAYATALRIRDSASKTFSPGSDSP